MDIEQNTIHDLWALVGSIFPNAVLGEDNEGQLVVYTGLKEDEDGYIQNFVTD